jgi:SAM-dependent methyltransferase
MDPWLVDNLRCPRDHQLLTRKGNTLLCPSGHLYPIHDGVPIMLLEEKPDTEPVFVETLKHAAHGTYTDPRKDNPLAPGEVDHIAQRLVAGSCGLMYRSLINNLKRYPIPRLRLKLGNGARILDIGCAWGRWSLAAASKGYSTVGIDPSIYNVLAARRIASQLGHANNVYLVADGRYLPFVENCFDAVFFLQLPPAHGRKGRASCPARNPTHS